MKQKLNSILICEEKIHCVDCRAHDKNGSRFRASVAKVLNIEEDYECPFGVKWDIAKPSQGFGDTLHKFFKWVGIKKKEGCNCGKRQKILNWIFDYNIEWYYQMGRIVIIILVYIKGFFVGLYRFRIKETGLNPHTDQSQHT